MRLNAIERLARRICWLEFLSPGRPKGGEVAYWKSLPEASRQLHIHNAAYFAGMLSRLQRSERSYQMVADAQIERAARVRK